MFNLIMLCYNCCRSCKNVLDLRQTWDSIAVPQKWDFKAWGIGVQVCNSSTQRQRQGQEAPAFQASLTNIGSSKAVWAV